MFFLGQQGWDNLNELIRRSGMFTDDVCDEIDLTADIVGLTLQDVSDRLCYDDVEDTAEYFGIEIEAEVEEED